MDSKKAITKLFTAFTLSCGLMTSGLMAAELSFLSMGKSYSDDGKNYTIVKLLKEGSKQHIREYEFSSEFILGTYNKTRIPLLSSNAELWDLGANKEFEVGDFVCSSEILPVLNSLNHKLYQYYEPITKPKDRETERALHKFFRNENDYTLWGNLWEYDFAKEFNLAQKIQLQGSINSTLLSRLYRLADGGSTIPEEVGLKDIDALVDIWDEYLKFAETRAKEFAALEANHKQKVLEYACAPVQKIKKGEDEYGDFAYKTTFDESKVIKHIEDLDPQKVLKFIPQEIMQYLKN